MKKEDARTCLLIGAEKRVALPQSHSNHRRTLGLGGYGF